MDNGVYISEGRNEDQEYKETNDAVTPVSELNWKNIPIAIISCFGL